MLDPAGGERADAAEARRLAALIDALGPRLAAATSVGPAEGVATPAGPPDGVASRLAVTPYVLDLAGGGQLLSLTNLDTTEALVELTADGWAICVPVPAATCLLLPRHLPVADAEIVLASAELVGLGEAGDVTARFATRGTSEVCLRLPAGGSPDVDGWLVEGDLRVTVDGRMVRVAGSAGGVVVKTPTGFCHRRL